MTTNRKRLLALGFALLSASGATMLNAAKVRADAPLTCDDKACDGFTCSAKTGSYCNDGNPDMCLSSPCKP